MYNTDDLVVKSILSKLEGEELLKAAKSSGLVYVQRQVTRNGKTFMQGTWVRGNQAEKEHKHGKDMKETHEMHKDADGTYNKGRMKLHEKIVNNIVQQCGKPAKGEKPVCVLMGGGSASGKSTMRDNVIEGEMSDKGIKAGTVDSDEIKKEIPEFESLKKTHAEDAARLVHEESSDIGALALDKLIEDGRHFVYDGTMKNKKKYAQLVERLQEAGYEVHAYVADVPLEEAIRRSDKRAARTGRKVPHSIIEASHRGVPGTIEHLKDKIDSYKVFDNTDTLKLIASNDYVDPDKYSKFLEKGGVSMRATAEK
jgi:predicted ABC-type ATPase